MNHGSFGACPAELLASQQRLRAQMEYEPVRFFVRELPSLMDEAPSGLAEFVGAEIDSIALLPNATTGINAVLRSYPFEAGDEILIIDHVYNAVRNAADYVAARAGAHVRTVSIPFPIEDPEIVVENIVRAVTPRTSLAILDHITSPTGLVMPMARLVSELRHRGVETLVDGAHAPGQLELSLKELGRPTTLVIAINGCAPRKEPRSFTSDPIASNSCGRPRSVMAPTCSRLAPLGIGWSSIGAERSILPRTWLFQTRFVFSLRRCQGLV